MDASPVQKLRQHLISSAIQRCRMLDDICRLSVTLKSSPLSNPPLVRISISDTGVGSCLEQFQDLKYTTDPISVEKWDGVISVSTTSISDSDIYHYELNLKESVSVRKLTKLPSHPKNGAKFSGTEVSLSTFEIVDDVLAEITCFLQKMLILKIPNELEAVLFQILELADRVLILLHSTNIERCDNRVPLKKNHAIKSSKLNYSFLKVATELVVDCGDLPGLHCKNRILANQCIPSSPRSNIECLKSGLEDYVFKHGNCVNNTCHSCFSSGFVNYGGILQHEHPNIQSKLREPTLLGMGCRNVALHFCSNRNKFSYIRQGYQIPHAVNFNTRGCLKIGSGVACCRGSNKSTGQVMDAVIIISESSGPVSPSCFRACGTKTEVLYFKDFSPCSIPKPSLTALTSIDWKSYGLTLMSIVDQDGFAFIEWENLPPDTHIDIVLHCYHKQVMMPPAKQKAQLGRTLTRKSVKLALNNLKEKNAGVLLSAHAVKICSYAPVLARTITDLILSSNDSNFQEECISLLGLQSQEIETERVEDCIKEKIISVIELNDRKPQRTREAAPFLFEDDCFQEPDFIDEEYEEGEQAFSSLDL